MIKQKVSALTLEGYFNYIGNIMNKFIYKTIFFIIFLLLSTAISFSQDSNNESSNVDKVFIPEGFPLAVIDMKKVLSISTAATELQKEMEAIQAKYREELAIEEEKLKNEQEELKAQKSILAPEQYSEREKKFRSKVDKLQKKVTDINRNLESTIARGMQQIQREAVNQIAIISREKGYLMVFDTKSVVIAAEQINISEMVGKKLNEALPKLIKNNNKEKTSEQN